MGVYCFGDVEFLIVLDYFIGFYFVILFNYGKDNDKFFKEGLELGWSFV